MILFLSLMAATLASEDLTLLGAGLLVQQGAVGLVAAMAACAFGIVSGDLGLWALGRYGGPALLGCPLVARHTGAIRLDRLHAGLRDRLPAVIVASRFAPGTRLPLYVAAGLAGTPVLKFGYWVAIATLLWVPPVVLLTAVLGETFTGPFAAAVGGGPSVALAAVAAFMVLGGVRRLASSHVRTRLAARLARWARWEFWPMWAFYAPVGLWVALLALKYRGLSTLTAANPGIPDGGTVGESKFAILAGLPPDVTIPSALVGTGAVGDRLARLASEVTQRGWHFPIIMKPDVGQRGVGVRLVGGLDEAATYLADMTAPVIVQPYHPGPYEAGVFYYRMPGDASGRILSITDKHFPTIVGDGESSLESLIWAHPRYRMQASTFLRRHRDRTSRVLARGEHFELGIAGNHAQGTLFRDGRHLLTPGLERRIDEIARAIPGFFVGRFDIRYRDVERFKAGQDLAIVELNGATAESTNIYDPGCSLLGAYRQLFRQWSIVFAIGAANRAAGAPVSSLRRLITLIRAHLMTKVAYQVSD
jgi:membrane protein DedA with SNARE-associated domain